VKHPPDGFRDFGQKNDTPKSVRLRDLGVAHASTLAHQQSLNPVRFDAF